MKNRAQGMTIIELMITVLVLAILMAIGIPSFREYTANSRTTAATNDLVTALNLARSEALRSATTTVVCASANQATCSGATDWSSGWIVFVDRDGNGLVGVDELLQVWPQLNGQMMAGATQPRVGYNAMGMGQLAGGAVTFRIGHPACNGQRVGQTIVSTVGSIQSSKEACPV